MHYRNTVEAVYIHIDELQQIISKIGADGKIHAIDVDLAMDKLRYVYDLMLSMKNEAGIGYNHAAEERMPEPELAKNKIENIQEPVVEKIQVKAEEKAIITIEEIPVEEKPDQPMEFTKVKTEPKPEIKAEPEITYEPEKTRAEIDTRIKTSDGKKIFGETFSSDKHSLNEELMQKSSPADLSSKFKTAPIASITGALGLNEKFELIQNLFGGDNKKYEKTIDILNTATNFNEAYDYLASNFNWDMNDVYTQRLLELIRRKLIVHKNG
jgi:hypothetical protein